MNTARGHHINCEFHHDQYPDECTCGASKGGPAVSGERERLTMYEKTNVTVTFGRQPEPEIPERLRTMRGRVADQIGYIAQVYGCHIPEHICDDLAEHAIRKMREPDDEMIGRGNEVHLNHGGNVTDIWQAMIDTALREEGLAPKAEGRAEPGA
jgi:hypothetical protein